MNERIKKLDWLADIVYPLLLVLMETFWVYPWLVWLGNLPLFAQTRPVLSLASVFFALAAACLAIRLFLRQKWSVRQVQAAIIGLGLVIIFLILSAEYSSGYGFLTGHWFAYFGKAYRNIFTHGVTLVFAFPVLLYLWWRGISLGQMTFDFKNIYRSFLLGIAALVFLIVIWQLSASSGYLAKPGPDIGFDVMAVFFFGLLAIAVSHLYTIRSTMPREEAALTSVWRWLPTMLIVIGGMIIVVFIIAGIFSPGFFTGVGHVFGIIFHFLGKIINYILIPLNYIFEAIVWVLRWIITRLRSNEPMQSNNSANMSFSDFFSQIKTAEVPAVLMLLMKWLVLAVIIAAVIFILARAVSRFRAQHAEEEIEEINESLFSWQGLGNDLRELLGMMGKRFQRVRSPPAPYPDDDETRRMDIREIYWHLLQEASLSGIARGSHETPGEYSQRLGPMVPNSHGPLMLLTDMYMSARYGEIKLPEEKLDSANGLWRTLRGLLRGLRGE
jgi:hypothetical protein